MFCRSQPDKPNSNPKEQGIDVCAVCWVYGVSKLLGNN